MDGRSDAVRALFEHASQAIISVGSDGSIVEANPAAAAMFGYAREELAGMPVEALLPPEMRERHREHRAKYFGQPHPRPMGLGFELAGQRKDGTRFPVEISLSYVTTESGAVAFAFVSDITARKVAEESSREQAATIRALLESASQCILGVDEAGRIVLVNAMAEALFRYSREELLGREMEMLLPAGVRERHVAHRRDYGAQPHVRTMGQGLALTAVRKDGSEFPVEISLSYVRTKQGLLAVAFITDITERKQAEELLVQQAEALARSNADLQQFAYVTSHDLQEPLRNITSYAQLLERRYRDTFDEDARTFLGYIAGGAQRLSALVSDLLSYSRVMNQKVPLQPVDANAAVRWARENVRSAAEAAEAEIIVEPLPVVLANEVQLVQIFQNLIGNSIKYRHPKRAPLITICARPAGLMWEFRVSDNGIGIEPEYHERIFGLFKRLHGAAVPGTGIGLTLCKKIIEQHGGSISIVSNAGEGTTFAFTLHSAALPVPTGIEAPRSSALG